MIVLDLSILNQKGTPMFNSDTFANRPAFGIVGRIFISTDTKEFFRDTGTSWELIGGPGSGTITGSGAATQVAFWNGASTITGSNNLFWDSTNNYLGISTNTPTTALDVHHSTNSGAIFNQTTATNNNTINFQTSGSGRWRIGNFYTAGADDFGIFDVVGSLQQLTILKTTGQTFIGAKTTASGRLVVNSATADAHLQIVGANAPSIRIDNAGSGGTQRFVFGLATGTNNFIQGATAGQFCISTQSSGAMLFGMWQTINATEAMRISINNNLLIGTNIDAGQRIQIGGDGTATGSFNANSLGLGGAVNALSWTLNTLRLGQGIYWNNIELWDGVDIRIKMFNGGNLLLQNGGTFTDGGQRLQVIGSAYISGNLGIGNSSPGYNLDVLGTGNFTGNISTSGTAQVRLSGPIDGSQSIRYNSTLDGLQIQGYGGLAFLTDSGSGIERMRITFAGNILVNSIIDNGNRFQVTGNSNITGNLGLGVVAAQAKIHSLLSGGTGAVGITGTTIIGQNSTAGNSSYITLIGAFDSESGIVFTDESIAYRGRIVYSNNTESMSFWTDLSVRMQIKNTGVINFSNVPNSSVGLSSGDIYQTAGVLNIVP